MRSQASEPRPRSWSRIPLAGSGMMLASEVSNARSRRAFHHHPGLSRRRPPPARPDRAVGALLRELVKFGGKGVGVSLKAGGGVPVVFLQGFGETRAVAKRLRMMVFSRAGERGSRPARRGQAAPGHGWAVEVELLAHYLLRPAREHGAGNLDQGHLWVGSDRTCETAPNLHPLQHRRLVPAGPVPEPLIRMQAIPRRARRWSLAVEHQGRRRAGVRLGHGGRFRHHPQVLQVRHHVLDGLDQFRVDALCGTARPPSLIQ